MPTPGYKFKVDIQATAYAAQSVRVVDRATGQDITNSEGATGSGAAANEGFETRVAGNGVAEVTITSATWDPAQDPFGVPYSLSAGTYIDVKYYINGRSGKFWHFPELYVETIEQAADAKGLQPITLTGTTDGIYFLPS